LTATRSSYVLVTPAKNEAENLRRLAACIADQTVLPARWMIVDDGSTDETPAVVAALAAAEPWIEGLRLPGGAMAPGPPVVRSFNAGLGALAPSTDIVVKLDADVSFESDYFERMLEAFAADERLGIASGVCWELENGDWVERHVTGTHVRGATRAYRLACLDDIGPLPEAVGWDGVDELKANVLGWRTASIAGLPFRHHRVVGERDGAATSRWLAEGRCAHFMGYRFSYLVARTIGRALRDRDPAAVAMLWSFSVASVRREPRYDDPTVRAHLRRQQRARNIPLRVREALGRR
jgi:glycosyltransferase involved in cell wall biosynthesis